MKNLWKSLCVPMLLMGIQFAVSMFASEIMMVREICLFEGNTYQEFMDSLMNALLGANFNGWIFLSYSLIAGGILFYLYYTRFVKQGENKKLNWFVDFKSYRPIMYLGLILLVFGMQYIMTYLVAVLAQIFPSWLVSLAQLEETAGISNIGSMTILMTLYGVVFGPICEELAFRGVAMGYAKRSLPFSLVNVFQASLFAMFHGNELQMAYCFLMGLLLGYVVEKSGNLFLGILLHIGFNLLSVLPMNLVYSATTPMMFALCIFAGLTVTYAGVLFIVQGSEKKVKEEKNSSDIDITV